LSSAAAGAPVPGRGTGGSATTKGSERLTRILYAHTVSASKSGVRARRCQHASTVPCRAVPGRAPAATAAQAPR
jgi:hypothetical protein